MCLQQQQNTVVNHAYEFYEKKEENKYLLVLLYFIHFVLFI